MPRSAAGRWDSEPRVQTFRAQSLLRFSAQFTTLTARKDNHESSRGRRTYPWRTGRLFPLQPGPQARSPGFRRCGNSAARRPRSSHSPVRLPGPPVASLGQGEREGPNGRRVQRSSSVIAGPGWGRSPGLTPPHGRPSREGGG